MALVFQTNWYGRKGVALTTIGGSDEALWGLRGQDESKPVMKGDLKKRACDLEQVEDEVSCSARAT